MELAQSWIGPGLQLIISFFFFLKPRLDFKVTLYIEQYSPLSTKLIMSSSKKTHFYLSNIIASRQIKFDHRKKGNVRVQLNTVYSGRVSKTGRYVIFTQ